MEEVSAAVRSPCPVVANTRAENSSQICYRKSEQNSQCYYYTWDRLTYLQMQEKYKDSFSPLTFPKHYLPVKS